MVASSFSSPCWRYVLASGWPARSPPGRSPLPPSSPPRPESRFATCPALACAGAQSGQSRKIGSELRLVALLPFEHAENIAAQQEGVAAYSTLHDELQATDPGAAEMAANFLTYAGKHRDIVAKFGRFPHRNAVLGRTSSVEELAFLEQPGSSF